MKKLFQLTIILFTIAALSHQALAQEQNANSERNPLVRLLQSKGIITEQEAAMISKASSPAQAERRLAELLLSKGVITRQEYEQTLLALGASSTASDSAAPRVVPAAAHVFDTSATESAAMSRKTPTTEVSPPQAQSEGPMTTLSKMPVKIYGSILFNANYVSHGANSIDIPLFPQKNGTSSDQNHQNFYAPADTVRTAIRRQNL